MKKLIISLAVLFLFTASLSAQYVPGIQWREIDTAHFRIIFPAELKTEAQRVANLMEHVYGPIGKTLKSSPGRFKLLLTNTGVTPNGYVRLAPKMSQWYHMPPQGYLLGSGEWYSLLATHETRHMVQFAKEDRAFTRIMHLLYGEIGEAAMEGFSVPPWYAEGDAVTTETALTNSGRGRLPSFTRDIRTLLLSGKKYSYYKAALGPYTYKDYYPSKYNLGFLLVAYLRNNRDAEVWSRILDTTSNFSFLPLMFNISVKLKTGKTLSGLYSETMDYLKAQWNSQLKGIKITEAFPVNKNIKHRWTSYTNPVPLNKGSLIALKWGMDDIKKLVQIFPDGTEKQILPVSPLDNHISVAKGIVVWSQAFPDPEWKNRAWADIVIYDTETKKRTRITSKGHYFVPSLAPNAKMAAAVEFAPDRTCSLVIFNIKNMKKIFSFPAGRDELFGVPAWTEGGKGIILTRQNLKGKSLAIIDIANASIKNLTPQSWIDIENPQVFKNWVFADSSYSGIDNIYALNLKTGKIYMAVSRKFGAYQPHATTVKGKPFLYFSDYTVNGFNIVKTELDPRKWIPLRNVKKLKPLFIDKITAQEQGGSIVEENSIPKVNYPVKKYSPLLNSINFHSWGIIPESVESAEFFFLSNDILGTTSFTPYVAYNFKENTFGGGLNLLYSGIFPNISLSSSVTGRHTFGAGEPERSYLEETGSLSLFFPLNFSVQPVTTTLKPFMGISYFTISNWTSTYTAEQQPSPVFPLTAGVNFSSYLKPSHRDILQRWGIKSTVSLTNTPYWNGDYLGEPAYQLFLSTQIYLPGAFMHDSIKLSAAYLNEYSGSYYISNSSVDYSVAEVHGYPGLNHGNTLRAASEYSFPIFYPDFAIGPFLYISRFLGKIFYDLGVNFNDYIFPVYQSAGAEFSMEFMPFTLPLPLNIGARIIYRITDNSFRLEDTILSLGINF
ncbi:MAG: hypothetical protein J7K04_01315 [Spirochaetales bacterium]|nr:hypothetical protein [Spirochaetales bacterium]